MTGPDQNGRPRTAPAAARDPGDVRMRGFSRRAEVADVWQWIGQYGKPLPAETVAIDHASGRVLASEVVAALDVPAFDRSAMDGYAVRGEETIGASDYNPLSFRVIGRALPGQPFDGTVQAGEAVRIMTGAPMPGGADAVVPAEYVRDTPQGDRDFTWPSGPASTWAASARTSTRGMSVLCRGQTAAAAGRRCAGIARHRSGRGDPQAPGAHRRDRQRSGRAGVRRRTCTRSTTPTRRCCADWSRATAACWRRICARVTTRLLIRDAITAPGADVVLVSGGSSVGTEDHAPRLLAEVGELAIHGVAMRPSSPAGCGRIGDTLVFLLPGNPVSCLCAYDFFAGRAIRLRGGLPMQWPYPERRVPGRPQDRFGHRARRLLPCAPARRRGRAAGPERRVDAVVDHARRRLRRRARRQRRPCAGQRSHRLPLRPDLTPWRTSLHRPGCSRPPTADRRSSSTVITRDEATERFRRHLKLEPLGHRDGAAGRRAGPRARATTWSPTSTCPASTARTSTASRCTPPTRSARCEEDLRRLALNAEVLDAGRGACARS